MKIIKRSGAEVEFNPEKIVIAVTKANESVVPSASKMSSSVDMLGLVKLRSTCERNPFVSSLRDASASSVKSF